MAHSSNNPAVFPAIADPTRRQILVTLTEGERTAGELAEPFDMSLSAISQHLAVLRGAGLVSERRQGRTRVYRLTPEPLAEVVDWVRYFDRLWDDRLERLQGYLDRRREESERTKS